MKNPSDAKFEKQKFDSISAPTADVQPDWSICCIVLLRTQKKILSEKKAPWAIPRPIPESAFSHCTSSEARRHQPL